MSVCLLLPLLAALADLPSVEVEPLKGERLSGQLAEVSSQGVKLRTGDAERVLPAADVLEIRFANKPSAAPSTGPRVVLIDGSQVTSKDFRITKDKAQLDMPGAEPLTIPVNRIAHVRFGVSSAKLDEAWNALLARDSKNDLLVVKKEDVLDFLSGVTGDVGEKVNFLLDGDEIPVAREKVYGILFRRRAPSLPKPACLVHLTSGDRLQAAEVAWDGDSFRIKTVAAGELTVSAASVASLDYSSGKVRYLSQVDPRDVKYVPGFDIVWEYQRDRNLDGKPIALRGKTFTRGLVIHSKTTLRYRIGGEFTRFQALAGIEDTVRLVNPPPLLHLTISGDGKPLFESDVAAKDLPKPLDLDVTGIRDLEIVVDFGDGDETADHLALGDAKLLK